jgi:carbamoyl-phosphate synthase small subunit
MRVGIFSNTALSREEMVVKVRKSPQMSGAFLADDVSTDSPYVIEAIGEKKFTVAAIDLGIKGATPRMMAQRGIEVHVLPSTSTLEDIKVISPDGIFLSNGPGDPATMTGVITLVREILLERIPLFGICFGHQIIGRALGFDTYKLPFGHRGINQPVKNLRTGRVEITAHNHGFAVEAPTEGNFNTVYGAGYVSHICLNDGVVEGLELLETPVFSVQYHPEAAGGPHDASYLFDHFASLMDGARA